MDQIHSKMSKVVVTVIVGSFLGRIIIIIIIISFVVSNSFLGSITIIDWENYFLGEVILGVYFEGALKPNFVGFLETNCQ